MRNAAQRRIPPHFTVAQTAIWLDQQLFGGMPIYNTGQALTISGPLHTDLFGTALRQTIAESPALQLVPGKVPVGPALQQHDLRQARDPRAAADQWMRLEMEVPFSLDEPALYRFALLRIADDRTIWFQKFHHIIIDATGRWLLSARTATRYRALRLGRTAPALQAATPSDVMNEEREYQQSDDHARDRRYWLTRFAHLPEPLLPSDRESSERSRSGRHARISFTLRRSDFARLEHAAKTMGSAASRAIIALTYVAFARFYDREHIVLGIELANRTSDAAKQMVGLLARPLPLALRADPGAPISEVLRQVDEARRQDYPHRHFPIQELVTALGLLRQGRHGLFDVVVNYVPAAYHFAFEDEPVEITNLSYGFAAPWMVTVADTGLGRDLDVTIDTDPGLISSETAARLATCLETLLLQGLDDPHRPLVRLPIMPEPARRELRAVGSGRTVQLPEGETLASLYRARAVSQPEAVALKCGGGELTFGVLEFRANRLARRLAGIGVGPGVIVGIALPRTPSLVVAVLAVLKAAGAYLPLDPSYPSERLRYIVADSAVPVVLTTAEHAPQFADSGARVLQDIESADVEIESAEPTPPQPHDRAYVLYTSGSTGRPKAVGIEHRSLVNLICWGRSVLSDREIGGMLFSTSLNFDIAAFEIFVPLVFGGCIVMVENLLALPSSADLAQVRFVNTGPSLIQALLRTGGLPAGVTTVLLAGERLPRHVVSELFAHAPGVRILNCYGPTETTVYSSCAEILPAERSDPSIGRPIWNTTFHVLTSSGALLPRGQEGELFIGGAGVARGYLGRPELSAERFLSHDDDESGRLYRTGDRVRWRSDGDLEFLGRADEQIKINGVRIEPGEIEAALLAVQGISMAAVMLREDDDGLRRLTAYMVATEGVACDTERVRAAVAQQLPGYMVPVSFVWLRAMPMTPNGKLNRKALPAPPRQQSRSAPNHPLETELERKLARMWGDVLGASPLDAGLDFFDLGGDSLALLNLFAAIEERFGRRLSVDVLAGGLSVAKLAQLLAQRDAPCMTSNPIVALQRRGSLPPLFMVPGIGGDVLQLHRLSVHMGQERPLYAFRWPADGTDNATVSELAASHVSAMLALQPIGPFYLGGYCLGATVAYEMACRLRQLGHEIGMLAIIDQRNVNWQITMGNLLPALFHAMQNTLHLFRHEAAPLAATRRIGRGVYGQMQRWARMAIGLPANESGDILELLRSTHGDIPGAQYIPALRSYRPMPSDVPVTLFRASEMTRPRMLLDETLGWGRLIGGDVEVHWVRGDHLSIIVEPIVRQLATLLSDALDRTRVVTAREQTAKSAVLR